MGLMNSSRSWSKEGSAEKQGQKEIQKNSQYLQDPCDLISRKTHRMKQLEGKKKNSDLDETMY
jgi:hypothetical protein